MVRRLFLHAQHHSGQPGTGHTLLNLYMVVVIMNIIVIVTIIVILIAIFICMIFAVNPFAAGFIYIVSFSFVYNDTLVAKGLRLVQYLICDYRI